MKQLEPFFQVPFFTAADAEKQDVPRHALAYLVKKGILEKDEKFVDETFRTRIAEAESYFANKQYLEAFQSFSAMATDFSELKDVSEIKQKVENLQKSGELRKAIREEEDAKPIPKTKKFYKDQKKKD